MFLKYPFLICFMCRWWFPQTHLQSIVRFLHEESRFLDVGVALQLQELAWAEGNEMAAIRWLASDSVQGFVEQLCEEGLCTSLAAERCMAEAKRWESCKVTHIATASRDMICARFSKQRELKALEIDRAERNLRRSKACSRTALVWKEDALRPHGRPFARAPNRTPKADSREAQDRRWRTSKSTMRNCRRSGGSLSRVPRQRWTG